MMMVRRPRASDPDPGRPEATTIEIRSGMDSVYCSHRAAEFARSHGFPSQAAWEIAISVSELVTNVVKFAGKGWLVLTISEDSGACIQIRVDDDGPGIPDVRSAMTDGWSEGRMIGPDDRPSDRHGLGLGLGAVKRLMDVLIVKNRPEGGTRVIAMKRHPMDP